MFSSALFELLGISVIICALLAIIVMCINRFIEGCR